MFLHLPDTKLCCSYLSNTEGMRCPSPASVHWKSGISHKPGTQPPLQPRERDNGGYFVPKREGKKCSPEGFIFPHLQQETTRLTLTYLKFAERNPTVDVKFSLSAGQTAVWFSSPSKCLLEYTNNSWKYSLFSGAQDYKLKVSTYDQFQIDLLTNHLCINTVGK